MFLRIDLGIWSAHGARIAKICYALAILFRVAMLFIGVTAFRYNRIPRSVRTRGQWALRFQFICTDMKGFISQCQLVCSCGQ